MRTVHPRPVQRDPVAVIAGVVLELGEIRRHRHGSGRRRPAGLLRRGRHGSGPLSAKREPHDDTRSDAVEERVGRRAAALDQAVEAIPARGTAVAAREVERQRRAALERVDLDLGPVERPVFEQRDDRRLSLQLWPPTRRRAIRAPCRRHTWNEPCSPLLTSRGRGFEPVRVVPVTVADSPAVPGNRDMLARGAPALPPYLGATYPWGRRRRTDETRD